RRATARVPWQSRMGGWLHEKGVGVLGPVSVYMQQLTWMRHLPSLPHRPAPPWADLQRETPEALKTVRGIWRDEKAADEAFEEAPFYNFFVLPPETRTWLSRSGWSWQIPTTPMRVRFRVEAAEVSAPDRQPPAPPPALDPAALTEEIRAEAKRLGLSRV